MGEGLPGRRRLEIGDGDAVRSCQATSTNPRSRSSRRSASGTIRKLSFSASAQGAGRWRGPALGPAMMSRQPPAGPEHAPDLAVEPRPVGDVHGGMLSPDHVKAGLGEGQVQRIGQARVDGDSASGRAPEQARCSRAWDRRTSPLRGAPRTRAGPAHPPPQPTSSTALRPRRSRRVRPDREQNRCPEVAHYPAAGERASPEDAAERERGVVQSLEGLTTASNRS